MHRYAALSPLHGMDLQYRLRIDVIGGLALVAHIMLVLPLALPWRGAAALLLLSLPGILLALALFRSESNLLTRIFLGMCGAIAFQIVLLLLLQSLRGPLLWWQVLGSADLMSITFFCFLLRQPLPDIDLPSIHDTLQHLPLALTLLLGFCLRFPFLGSAELQGDEANVLLLGTAALLGRDEILLLHRKGPVEVLLPAGPLALLGQTNEWLARLPFALSGMGVIIGCYLLSKRILRHEFSKSSDLPARIIPALILALDGFLIAYSRMVQYQNVVVLMSIGAVWCAWRFYEGTDQPRRYLIGAAVLGAIAGLAHYDGAVVFPVLLWLVLAGGRRRNWRVTRWISEVGLTLGVYAGLLLSFYIPFVLHEHFQSTLRNLMKRTGQRDMLIELFNNLPFYERVSTFYNTTFQIHWLAGILAIAMLVWLWLYVRPRLLGAGLAALLLAGCALLLYAPQRFESSLVGNWAIVLFALPLAGLILAPATPAGLRTLLLWFSAPFIVESFLITDPKTHFYSMDAAAALLIGWALTQLVCWLQAHRIGWLRLALALGSTTLALLATLYLYLVFIRQTPEYRIVFPAARPQIYQASYGDTLPPKAGYFGFPHRAGWKVIGELYRRGILQGDFESNEDYYMTSWYLGQEARCDYKPNYYFLSQNPIDPAKVPLKQIQQEYQLFGSVEVDGVKQIEIYSRQPVTAPVQIFQLDDYISAFDSRSVVNLATPALVFDLLPLNTPQIQWQQGAILQQTGVRQLQLFPGESTKLTFHWRATSALDADTEVFATLSNTDGTIAELKPLCESGPPAEWHTRQDNYTSFMLSANVHTPPDEYTVDVGLRKQRNGVPLLLSGGTETVSVAKMRVETP